VHGPNGNGTDDMTAGGLVAFTGHNDAAHGGEILPLSDYLDKDTTKFCYWLENDGTVHGTTSMACK